MAQTDAVQTIFQILHMLASTANGVSTPEIAAAFDISRQTAHKYIGILQDAGIPLYDLDRRWYLDQAYRIPAYWSGAETELLRVMIERVYRSGLAVDAVIRSLAQKLIPGGIVHPTSRIMTGSGRERDLFQRLAEAKRNARALDVVYHGLHSPAPQRLIVKPYKFLMPVWSDALYIIGDGRPVNGAREFHVSLKFDRLIDARMLDEQFVPPAPDDVDAMLETSWAVWQSGKSPVPVRLRFVPRLYRRLLESQWHPSQQIEQMADGSVLWQVALADIREIVPWIRAWGNDVEVIEPPALREMIVRDLRSALHLYEAQPAAGSDISDWLWAKYDAKTARYHPLMAHLLDVAAVASAMWETLPTARRSWVCQQMNLSEEQAMRVCSLLIGLHDIGKASPGFQTKAGTLYQQLDKRGYSLRSTDAAHGIVSAAILKQDPLRLPTTLACAIGGHHGEWVRLSVLDTASSSMGDAPWRTLQTKIIERVKQVLGIDRMIFTREMESTPFAAFIAGYTSVADWIGSNETYFPYAQTPLDADAYFIQASDQARYALLDLNWGAGGVPPDQSFAGLFAFEPNAVQAEIMAALDEDNPPQVIVIEAPTGIGKTEAALYAANWLSRQTGVDGLYIAMPTQATTNQMFTRAGEYLRRAFPDEAVNYQLIHSQSDLNVLYQDLKTTGRRDGNESGPIAIEWFGHRKRALLSRFATGTVDQALLSILKVRHFFVRLYGLSHRVVIFDEIHAYDTYMSVLFDRLLEWLKALGSPVILLSATLPASTRNRLLKTVMTEAVRYPRATLQYADGTVRTVALPAPDERVVRLESIPGDGQALLDVLMAGLEDGGCAAVVCNTVREAQEMLHWLADSGVFSSEELLLFHAQFPPQWRDGIERSVVERFGKRGDRPARAVLVATQVIEQSLDLDFDMMVTATAPIDLLIQRMGRLHRHPRERPGNLTTPTLFIRQPELVNGVPDWGADGYVYEPYILLHSWWQMRGRSHIVIPSDLDALIEAVYQQGYHENPDWPETLRAASRNAFTQMEMGADKDRFIAGQPIIPAPSKKWRLDEAFADDPVDEDHSVIARTRLIDPGVQIVCLHVVDEVLSFEPDEVIECDLHHRPGPEEVRLIQRYSLNIRRRGLKEALEKLPPVEKWQGVRTLEAARAIVFENGRYEVPGTKMLLRLSYQYGLEIEEEA